MRKEAAYELAAAMDEIRLLVEAGYADEARALVRRLRRRAPNDVDLIGLQVWIDHRRGAISEALDGWRELHDARPNGSVAMVRLAQLRAEETVPVRRHDLPAVRRVLRMIAQGQYEQALPVCAQAGATAAATGDREQRKLLALIEALLHELAGRPSAAAAVLTALGNDPAFAHDVDRLAILARVCEQAGDRAGLEAAERVLVFLSNSGILSAFPRLQQIRRSLGDEAGARAVEARWEEAFRKRLQRLTPEARIAAATRRFVPPERIERLPLPAPETIADPVQRAVRLLLAGDVRGSLPQLAGVPAWRAIALERIGDRQGALESAGQALRTEATLPHALLYARLAGDDQDRDLDLLLRARAVLREASDGAADPELLEARARVASALGESSEADALRARAAAAARRRWPAPGTVRAAAVYAMPGRAIGLVHQIIVRPLPGAGSRERGRLVEREIHGASGNGVRAHLRRVFAAVREVLEAKWPERTADFDRCGWSIHFTKEDEPSGGPSLGLPAAVAFASAMLDVAVSPALVFTGAVSYDAAGRLAVRPIGELGRKLEAVLHAGADALVFPAAQREEAFSGQVVPPAFAREIAAPVATFDEAIRIAFEGVAVRA